MSCFHPLINAIITLILGHYVLVYMLAYPVTLNIYLVYAILAFLFVLLPGIRRKNQLQKKAAKQEYILDSNGNATDTLFRQSDYRNYKCMDSDATGRSYVNSSGQIICTVYRSSDTDAPSIGLFWAIMVVLLGQYAEYHFW